MIIDRLIDNTNACQVGTKLLVTDIFLHISNKIQIYLILISELFIDISIIQYIVQRRRRIKIRHHKKVYLEAVTPESRSYVMLWKTVTTVSRVTRLL